MFPVAICNELYRGWSHENAFRHARSCGYAGVEIAPHTLGDSNERFSDRRAAELGRAASDQGLSIIGLHWLLAETVDIHWTSPNPRIRRNTVDYFQQLIELCAKLQGRVMVLGSPRQRNLAEGISFEQGLGFATDVLEQIEPKLAAHQVTLAVEPLGPHETNFLNTAKQASEFIQRFESPWLKLQLDVKAMSTEVIPIPEIIATHRHELAHFHANDPNRRGPGMGQVDFVPILKSLIDAEYRGWVSVEVFDESPGIETLATESIRNLQRDYSRALAL